MSCAAPAGGYSADGTNTAKESVIQGVVTRDGAPVAGAYVRLLDSGLEFTAEVPTNAEGSFRFFAAPGDWTLRTLAPGVIADRRVTAVQGEAIDVNVELLD